MKIAYFLFCSLLIVSTVRGEETTLLNSDEEGTVITTTVKKNPNGGYVVHSIAESTSETSVAGDPLRGGSMTDAETEEDISGTVASTSAEALERLDKIRAAQGKVKAGPNGEGDMRTGGDFPPIIVIIGPLGPSPQLPKMPKDAITMKYKNRAQFNSNYGRDLSKSVSRLGLRS